MSKEKFMSGAEFKAEFGELLRTLKDDDHVYFGRADAPLTLYRFKGRGSKEGPNEVQIEFNELYNIKS